MSDNPNTKAYRRRIIRLGKAIRWQHTYRPLERIIEDIDANASPRLVEAALGYAIANLHTSVDRRLREIESLNGEIEQVGELISQRRRPALKVVGGSA